MLPSSSSQTFLFDGTNSSVDISTVQDQPNLAEDPNRPEMFHENVKTAIQYVEVISKLANTAIMGIEQAFHADAHLSPGSASADIASVKHYLSLFTDHLVQTGVGALPMMPEGLDATPKDEASLLAEASSSVKDLYARKQQLEENHGIVASLLTAAEINSTRR